MISNKRPDEIRQGQIYYVDFPVSDGSVQAGIRPVVVTSSNRRNKTSPTVIVAIITSQLKRLDLGEHVLLPRIKGLPKDSMVEAEQRFTVDKEQLIEYRGKLFWHTWCRVHRALRKSERTRKREYVSQW